MLCITMQRAIVVLQMLIGASQGVMQYGVVYRGVVDVGAVEDISSTFYKRDDDGTNGDNIYMPVAISNCKYGILNFSMSNHTLDRLMNFSSYLVDGVTNCSASNIGTRLDEKGELHYYIVRSDKNHNGIASTGYEILKDGDVIEYKTSAPKDPLLAIVTTTSFYLTMTYQEICIAYFSYPDLAQYPYSIVGGTSKQFTHLACASDTSCMYYDILSPRYATSFDPSSLAKGDPKESPFYIVDVTFEMVGMCAFTERGYIVVTTNMVYFVDNGNGISKLMESYGASKYAFDAQSGSLLLASPTAENTFTFRGYIIDVMSLLITSLCQDFTMSIPNIKSLAILDSGTVVLVAYADAVSGNGKIIALMDSTCKDVAPYCTACDQSGTCISCQSNTTLFSNTCINDPKYRCDVGYFGIKTSCSNVCDIDRGYYITYNDTFNGDLERDNYCALCHVNCMTCTATDRYCTSCSVDYLIYQNTGECISKLTCDLLHGFSSGSYCFLDPNVRRIPEFPVVDPDSSLTTSCRPSCATCHPDAPGACLSCFPAYFLSPDAAECLPCDSSCSSCKESPTNCISDILPAANDTIPLNNSTSVNNSTSANNTSQVNNSTTPANNSSSPANSSNSSNTTLESNNSTPNGTSNNTDTNTTSNSSNTTVPISTSLLELSSSAFVNTTLTVILSFSSKIGTPSLSPTGVRVRLYRTADELRQSLTGGESGISGTSDHKAEASLEVVGITVEQNRLMFKLKVKPIEVENASLLVNFGASNSIWANDDSEKRYEPSFVTISNVTITRTSLDEILASMKGGVGATVAATTSIFLLASSTQGFFIIKIMQTVEIYVYINVFVPANFVLFMQMMTQNALTLVPNIFESLITADVNEERDQFNYYGVTVHMLHNIGQFFTFLLFCCFLRFLVSFLLFFLSLIKYKSLLLLQIRDLLHYKFFYEILESNHQDVVLAILISFFEYNRLLLPSPARSVLLLCVCAVFTSIVTMYLLMFYKMKRHLRSLSTSSTSIHQVSPSNRDLKEPHEPHEAKIPEFPPSISPVKSPVKPPQKPPAKQADGLVFLWEDKTEGGNFFQMHFNLINLLKDVYLVSLVYFLYYFPFSLLVLLASFQLLFLIACCYWKPYEKAYKNNQLIILQAIYFTMECLLMVLIGLQRYGASYGTGYYGVGFPLIGCYTGLFAVAIYYACKLTYNALKVYFTRVHKIEKSEKTVELSKGSGKGSVSSERTQLFASQPQIRDVQVAKKFTFIVNNSYRNSSMKLNKLIPKPEQSIRSMNSIILTKPRPQTHILPTSSLS